MSVELNLWKPTAREVAETVGGILTAIPGADADIKITNVATASGDCSAGSLFCAIKGERADGADYIPQAAELGAVCILTTRDPADIPDPGTPVTIVTVDDVVRALGKLASRYRSHSRARFVAVTGSVGTTTTKEMIASVA
ncbi:MAG: UDP-N-acetylmuramoylalanyl-D-glutamyl-2, 6-diaminopimelate--D-alanyl-D-alanine ligase, partial [Clostridia bacterium]|nr:UDP-N-acetylmuramoylalanyl-D-glutamyl-2, 6-diaminopimelate--D-alanyl-D-alanine ligase [Clostridia bacterium]